MARSPETHNNEQRPGTQKPRDVKENTARRARPSGHQGNEHQEVSSRSQEQGPHVVTVVVLFWIVLLVWIVLLGIQVAISVHLIRNKPPRGCTGRDIFYRMSAIVCGFIPLPLMELGAQLVYFALYRGQVRGLRTEPATA